MEQEKEKAAQSAAIQDGVKQGEALRSSDVPDRSSLQTAET